MSIQILSSDVVNQISAGEVVEKPAHLVKELVENSLDAGATEISIEIRHGGRFVKIQDNGEGIRSFELKTALERHATSKIKISDDLWNLNSFGFRGEALASIAAVAEVQIQSCHVEEKNPSQILCKFGKTLDLRPSSRREGTEIAVENLFDNVPARLKFLKSDSAEVQAIKTVIRAIALAHPGVQFKLSVDGGLQFFFQKKTKLLERAREVLEKSEMYTLKSRKNNMDVEIVFSSPHEVAKTSKQIWIFAQNRFVQDRALQAAIMDAYRSLLMHGEYPHVVCKINCLPQEIDVNIHPTKSQVKFQDPSAAFRAVHGTLREALEKAPWIKNSTPHAAASPMCSSLSADTFETYESVMPTTTMSFQDHTLSQTQFKQKSFIAYPQTLETYTATAATGGYWSSLQVLGQANLTYIICQKDDRLVYVDQHAAHERVVFESLMKAWKEKKFEIQDYLFPFVIDLTEEKVDALLAIEATIHELGISIERLGPLSLGIKAAPTLIKDSSLVRVFEKMANDLIENGGTFAIEKSIGDIFATMACHSVVRAGQSLSHSQMQELLKSMDQFALSSFCPHGRPVSVDTTFIELEKQFGRIN